MNLSRHIAATMLLAPAPRAELYGGPPTTEVGLAPAVLWLVSVAASLGEGLLVAANVSGLVWGTSEILGWFGDSGLTEAAAAESLRPDGPDWLILPVEQGIAAAERDRYDAILQGSGLEGPYRLALASAVQVAKRNLDTSSATVWAAKSQVYMLSELADHLRTKQGAPSHAEPEAAAVASSGSGGGMLLAAAAALLGLILWRASL